MKFALGERVLFDGETVAIVRGFYTSPDAPLMPPWPKIHNPAWPKQLPLFAGR